MDLNLSLSELIQLLIVTNIDRAFLGYSKTINKGNKRLKEYNSQIFQITLEIHKRIANL